MSNTPQTESSLSSKNDVSWSEDLINTNTHIKDGIPPDKLTVSPGALHADRLILLQRVIAQGRNPFLCASQVILRAIADIPQTLAGDSASGAGGAVVVEDAITGKAAPTLQSVQIETLRGLLEQEMHIFTQLCDQTNLRRDHMLAVRFALCTALDEAVGRTSWGGGVGQQTGQWSTKPLLSTFHQETGGGDKVFLLIGRLAASPEEHMNVLEVMLHLLGLGLVGNYGRRDDGARLLDTVRERLYTTIASRRDPVPKALSPNWQGVGGGKFKILRSIPVWVTASVAALALFGAFSWYKYQLLRDTKALEVRINDLLANKPTAQPVRLKTLLAKEIKTGQVSVVESGAMSKVVFRGDDMFVPGQAVLTSKAVALLNVVGKELNEIPGTIVVEGHSDNQPINTPEYPNNLVLSQKRAAIVAKAFETNGVPASRLKISGAADSKPAANNNSAAGRAKNRRVELLIGADAVLELDKMGKLDPSTSPANMPVEPNTVAPEKPVGSPPIQPRAAESVKARTTELPNAPPSNASPTKAVVKSNGFGARDLGIRETVTPLLEQTPAQTPVATPAATN